MTKLNTLLDEYEESHKHPVNVAIHWVAEPLAIFALMALAGSMRLPVGSLLWPFLAVLLIYFGLLSVRLILAFLPVVVAFVFLLELSTQFIEVEIWKWAMPLFAVCWFTLLLGHRIEGRVPSVFQNPNLIFVGPAWLMRIIFRRLNLPDP